MASFESIRARMSIKYILNPLPSQEPDYSAFPGHPRFSNGSMPMTLLVAPANPAIANPLADVWTWEWEREQEFIRSKANSDITILAARSVTYKHGD
ncbi:hypothetical protein VP1G_11331 [Cytospora mali]|uniref:Uncharacterized protein n=1 Tax=Cytospora mali TaxID=578113 RepID=A0A194VDV7_CYTMA|nr:hypothetical protein VP1G_11331 [Valsa mali var. pyri (nom. inval.)]